MLFVQVCYVVYFTTTIFSQPPVFNDSRTYVTLYKRRFQFL